jgi:hypothetical protein
MSPSDPIAKKALTQATPSPSGQETADTKRKAKRRAVAIPSVAGVTAALVVVIVSLLSEDGTGALGVVIAGVVATSASLYVYLTR